MSKLSRLIQRQPVFFVTFVFRDKSRSCFINERVEEMRTNVSTSRYRSPSRRALSTSSGGPLGRGGRFVTRNQQYRDIRRGLGLSGG